MSLANTKSQIKQRKERGAMPINIGERRVDDAMVKNGNWYNKLSLALLVILSVVITDQMSKALILDVLSEKEAITLLPFLRFILVKNYGVSFGTFNSPAQNQLIFIALSSLIIVALAIWLIKSKSKLLWCPTGMVIGGAIGNCVDRLVHGAVIDFIDVIIIGWHYPTFNIADTFICIGVSLMLFLKQ